MTLERHPAHYEYVPFQRDHDRRLLSFARVMRKNCSDAERKLWFILRDRKLARFKCRRQFPIAGYIADFYCVKAKLVVECDGGRHNEPDAQRYDAARTDRFNQHGIQVVRFWANDVLKHPTEVAESIYRSLVSGQLSPQPSPGIPGEGEEAEPACEGVSL